MRTDDDKSGTADATVIGITYSSTATDIGETRHLPFGPTHAVTKQVAGYARGAVCSLRRQGVVAVGEAGR